MTLFLTSLRHVNMPALPASLPFSPKAIAAIVGLSAIALLAACGQSNSGAPGAGGPPGGAMPAMPVTVLAAKVERVPSVVEAVGQTEGAREVEVRARASGIVERQLYKEGEPVRAGATLFQIDRAPYEIALAQARAALAQEQARNEQAKRESGRLKALADDKAISQKEYDDATSTAKQSDAAIVAAQAKVRDAELNLSYTVVTAPIAGISGRAQRSEGSLVSATSDSGLLTTITQTDPIRVRFALSETEFQQLRAGGKQGTVQLRLPDGKLYAAAGKLNFASSVVDPKLGTVQLRAEFANPDLALLPGQFVRALLTTGERDAVLVPQLAVLQSDQGRIVWIVGADGKAAPRPVEVAGASNNQWIVVNGLKAGDQIIVDNLMKVRPGAAVAPHPPGPPAGAPAAAAPGAKP
jgi:membrane fusion protein (multidrug efflux system)